VTSGFSSVVAEPNGRKRNADFREGQRLTFERPYVKKPGMLLVKLGTAYALAPVGSTDLMDQIKQNERMGRKRPVVQKRGAPPAAKAQLEMKVVKGKGQRNDGTDYDNKSQSVVMHTQIKSREFKRSYQGVTAKIWVLGRAAAANMKDRHFQMIAYKEHTFDLAPGKVETFSTNPVQLRYDDNAGAKFGTKFYGYLLEVYEDGKVVASKSNPSTLLKYADSVRSQRVSGTGMSGSYFKLK